MKKKHIRICCRCHVKIDGNIEYLLTEENKLEREGFYSFRKWSTTEKTYYYCCQKHFKEDSLYDSMFIPISRGGGGI